MWLMTVNFRHLCHFTLSLALLATLGVGQSLGGPPTIGFRNDTQGPVMVQGLILVNKTLRRGKVHTLQPGEIAYEVVAFPTNKLVIVADAKQPTRTLFQGTVPFVRADQFFSIQDDSPPAKKGNAPQAASLKVKLLPASPPAQQAAPPSSTTPRR